MKEISNLRYVKELSFLKGCDCTFCSRIRLDILQLKDKMSILEKNNKSKVEINTQTNMIIQINNPDNINFI